MPSTHKVDFFIEDGWFGRGAVEEEFHGTAGVCRPRSTVWVCPECGRVWARIEVEGAKFFPVSHPCGRHEATSFYSPVPGSIWTDWERQLMRALPPAMLVREFHLNVKHWEKHNAS
jgi:hypothetical protein